ncbi:hypothetical protein MLD38_023588 [Melastoma candidum]|uniref:Uncharacterized protein n=1 Tax=Melastoma candidum TaxID=119954 RepID=A0ACB9NR89_9MYRT|nr:hypothetical protein MLD38_023588 [Melastoma candidum]
MNPPGSQSYPIDGAMLSAKAAQGTGTSSGSAAGTTHGQLSDGPPSSGFNWGRAVVRRALFGSHGRRFSRRMKDSNEATKTPPPPSRLSKVSLAEDNDSKV